MKISDDAKEYIRKKGGFIYIKYYDIKNCCIELNLTPGVFIGIPFNLKKYYVIEIDRIKVYVDNMIYKKELEDLTIELKNFFGIKYLVVNGWKLL